MQFSATECFGEAMTLPRITNTQPSTRAEKVNPTLEIIYRNLCTLHQDSTNSRVHSAKQIRQIARSIKTFGFNVPFLVDRNLKLVAGHGRLEACKLLGITRVPTISLPHLTREQASAFMIADNRLTEIAAWDDRILAEQLKSLSEVELNFDLEVTGFEMGEIDLLIEGLSLQAPDEVQDALPEMQSPTPVTKSGIFGF